MADPLDIPKYRNAAHALYTVLKEEGVGALYRGISLTALRQGTWYFSLLQENMAFQREIKEYKWVLRKRKRDWRTFRREKWRYEHLRQKKQH
jgi:hypothetical protein